MASSRDDFIIAIRSAFLKKSTKQKFSLLTLSFLSIFIIVLSSFDLKPVRLLKSIINEINVLLHLLKYCRPGNGTCFAHETSYLSHLKKLSGRASGASQMLPSIRILDPEGILSIRKNFSKKSDSRRMHLST